MNDIVNIDIAELICHEKTSKVRLDELIRQIKRDKKLKKPVVVDRKTMVILDGHHRYQAFLQLGFKKIYCYLVNYFDEEIKVNFRRPDVKNKLIKEIILQKVRKGEVFPYKTTKHLLPYRPVINKKLDL
jgi:hypothetical protein